MDGNVRNGAEEDMARIGLSVAILQEDKKDIRKLRLQIISDNKEYSEYIKVELV